MFDVTKCAVQEAIIDLGTAFRAFFEKRGAYPRSRRKVSMTRFARPMKPAAFVVTGGASGFPSSDGSECASRCGFPAFSSE